MVGQASAVPLRVVRRHVEWRRHLDADGALPVGASDLDAELVEDREDLVRRMAVAVVDAGADQPDARGAGRQEGRVGGRGAVVGHGQHLGAQQVGPRQQVGLRRLLDVPGEQHPPPLVGDAHHDRGVVELAPRPPVGTAWWRAEHLEVEVPDACPVPGDRVAHRDPLCAGEGEHHLGVGQLGRQRPQPHRAHRHRLEHVGHATDVVEMGMGDDDQVEMAPAMLAQPPGRGAVLARVDEDARGRRLHQEGVALPDVDRGHRQDRRR